jgi:hypothetical protein
MKTDSPEEEIFFDQTLYRTTQAGQIRAVADAVVEGRLLGSVSKLSVDQYYNGSSPTQQIKVEEGETFEYLQYRAEGTCFVRISGRVVDADPCPAFVNSFVVAAEPQTEWWIHIVAGQIPAGWLRVDDGSVAETDRDFSGRPHNSTLQRTGGSRCSPLGR